MVVEITDQFLETMRRRIKSVRRSAKSIEGFSETECSCELNTWLAIWQDHFWTACIDNTKLICDCEDGSCLRCQAEEADEGDIIQLPAEFDLAGWDVRYEQRVTIDNNGQFAISDFPYNEGRRYWSPSLRLSNL